MICPYDSAPVILADSVLIYGRSYGPIWLCSNYPRCDAYVGCHPNTDKPLGRLANKELRAAKTAAHAMFDPLWKKKLSRDGGKKCRSRGAGYAWLAKQLGIPTQDCHIGMFDVELCRKVVAVCAPFWKPRVAA